MRGVAVLLLLMLVAAAVAEPYWVEYDPSAGLFPEELGWERTVYGGGAERSFDDGALVLDGSESIQIVDDYWMQASLECASGEQFLIEWRLRVDEVAGFADPIVGVSAAGHGVIALSYTPESIYSLLEDVWIPFAPGQYHAYALASSDMLNYELRIDGVVAHVGQFVGPCPQSGITWGDGASGASSISVWDYVRFGVIPEPSTGILFALGVLLPMASRSRLARRAVS